LDQWRLKWQRVNHSRIPPKGMGITLMKEKSAVGRMGALQESCAVIQSAPGGSRRAAVNLLANRLVKVCLEATKTADLVRTVPQLTVGESAHLVRIAALRLRVMRTAHLVRTVTLQLMVVMTAYLVRIAGLLMAVRTAHLVRTVTL
jgi:hypothetical protein